MTLCTTRKTGWLVSNKKNKPYNQFHRHQLDRCRLSVQCESQHDEDLPKSDKQISASSHIIWQQQKPKADKKTTALDDNFCKVSLIPYLNERFWSIIWSYYAQCLLALLQFPKFPLRSVSAGFAVKKNTVSGVLNGPFLDQKVTTGRYRGTYLAMAPMVVLGGLPPIIMTACRNWTNTDIWYLAKQKHEQRLGEQVL